jgi:hypothetical protein
MCIQNYSQFGTNSVLKIVSLKCDLDTFFLTVYSRKKTCHMFHQILKKYDNELKKSKKLHPKKEKIFNKRIIGLKRSSH